MMRFQPIDSVCLAIAFNALCMVTLAVSLVAAHGPADAVEGMSAHAAPADPAEVAALTRFRFVPCGRSASGAQEPTDCLQPADRDVVKSLEMCLRDTPCRFADVCLKDFHRHAPSELITQTRDGVGELQKRAAERCRVVSSRASLDGPPAPPGPVPSTAPAAPAARARHVAAGSYYADLNWVAKTVAEKQEAAGGNCRSARLLLKVAADYSLEWTIDEATRSSVWRATVDPATSNVMLVSGQSEIRRGEQTKVAAPGEVAASGRFSQFTVKFAPCGDGRITVRNLAKADGEPGVQNQ